MNSLHTTGVVLSRTNFGEADRIITVLTPDSGKLRLIAKGARKQGSKLAGGIELLSVSQLSYIPGRRDLGTLVSSRIERHFGAIVKDIERTMYAYELLKAFNRLTEDLPEEEYFVILIAALAALEAPAMRLDFVDVWVKVKLLEQGGRQLNTHTDSTGELLTSTQTYIFDMGKMALAPHPDGDLDVRHIKILKLTERLQSPEPLLKIVDAGPVIQDLHRLLTAIAKEYL
jgi:DNA repair protein RecO (recombination protein O)